MSGICGDGWCLFGEAAAAAGSQGYPLLLLDAEISYKLAALASHAHTNILMLMHTYNMKVKDLFSVSQLLN